MTTEEIIDKLKDIYYTVDYISISDLHSEISERDQSADDHDAINEIKYTLSELSDLLKYITADCDNMFKYVDELTKKSR